jgi:D-alanine-D-alanine ligase
VRSELRIAVVSGGPSAEAEVSRVSGRGVAEALKANFSQVDVLELDHDIMTALERKRPDVVFPVLHGPPGEDGTFQGFLEVLGLPYVGSGVAASAFAMNKIVAKQMFRIRGLPVAKDVVVRRDQPVSASEDQITAELKFEVVVKPSGQGSAVGVRFASNRAELRQALEEAFAYNEEVLVEERVHGKEITVAILERDGIESLPVTEVTTPAGSWYDFEHRYTPGLSEHIIPAPLPEEQYTRTQAIARQAHAALGCRDLSRVDFVVPEQGEPIVLEVNTIPGMTPTSLYPDAARAAGLPFEALVRHLVDRALSRVG